jgi:hypothetical protein
MAWNGASCYTTTLYGAAGANHILAVPVPVVPEI